MHINEIKLKSDQLSGVQPSMHLIGRDRALIYGHSGFRCKNRRILMKIRLESRNNSYVWHPYVTEELGLARPAANIEVSTKVSYFSSDSDLRFPTFSTISANIDGFVPLFIL